MPEVSGAQWCARFPTSTSIADLIEPFRTGVSAFVAALRDAGASVTVSATWRPKQRAYLMHGAWLIAREGFAPASVPHMDGVDIDWTHGGDVAMALAAAETMVQAYGIAFCPSLESRHTQRRAIDMTIRFKGALSVRRKDGSFAAVAAITDLWPVGKGYGVVKLPADAPHWSDDGH